MKKVFYTQPTIEIENVVVESGIAASPVYDVPGGAGQGGYNDYEGGDL